jgi:nuclear pore complex protein Nup93
LADANAFNAEILARAAAEAEDAGRVPEAVKLYNLAGAYDIVIGVLARALGGALSADVPGDREREMEKTARDVLRHYERTNRAPGREREAVVRLLRVRDALDAKAAGRPDVALEVMESTGLVPLDGDVARIARRADEFGALHDALQRNLPQYLTLTMDLIAGVYARVKASGGADTARLMACASLWWSLGAGTDNREQTMDTLRQKARSLLVFAGALKYRMAPDVYAYLAQKDVEICL